MHKQKAALAVFSSLQRWLSIFGVGFLFLWPTALVVEGWELGVYEKQQNDLRKNKFSFFKKKYALNNQSVALLTSITWFIQNTAKIETSCFSLINFLFMYK